MQLSLTQSQAILIKKVLRSYNTELLTNYEDWKDYDNIFEQFAELVVDGMDTKDLVRYVFADMMDHFVSLTADELEEEVYNHDEELWEELVDNVTSKTITQGGQS